MFRLPQVLLGIGIATRRCAAEAVERLLLPAAEPVGGAQGVLGPLVVVDAHQQAQGLMVAVAAVGVQQFAGLVDGHGRLVLTRNVGVVAGPVLRYRSQDGIFFPCCSGRTARNVVHNVQGGLRHGEGFLLPAELLPAVSTLETVELREVGSHTNDGLDIPMTTQRPGVAIERAQGKKVALAALVAHGFVHAKGKLHISHVVVTVQKIRAEEMMYIDRVCPKANLWGEQQMTPFLRPFVAGRPGAIACRQPCRPMG